MRNYQMVMQVLDNEHGESLYVFEKYHGGNGWYYVLDSDCPVVFSKLAEDYAAGAGLNPDNLDLTPVMNAGGFHVFETYYDELVEFYAFD